MDAPEDAMHIDAPEDAIHMDTPECFLCLLSLLGHRLSILKASHRLGMALSAAFVSHHEVLGVPNPFS